MTTTSRLLTGCALAATLFLAACGDDSAPDAPATASAPPASGTAPAGSGLSSVETSLETMGHALQKSIGEKVKGYDVSGSTLRLQINEDFSEFQVSECMVIELVAPSLNLPADAAVEVEYHDGHVVVCDV